MFEEPQLDLPEEEFEEEEAGGPDRRWLIVFIGLAVGGGLLICIALILILFPPGDEVAEGTVTPLADGTPLPAFDILISGISNSGVFSLTLDAPSSLTIDNEPFFVQAQRLPDDGFWDPVTAQEDTAIWVYGTIINYSFGILDTVENRALMESLVPGDDISIATRSGNVIHFAFNSREVAPINDTSIFSQISPGVTLVLLGTEGEQRLVVHGTYVVSEASAGGAAANGDAIELGETAQIGNLQITVTGATHQRNRPEISPGFDFYLIDYEIQNNAAASFDVSLLQMTLIDNMGNQYALNGTASQVGNYPSLGGLLNPGQLVRATAGYQIPENLSSATLRWRVTRSDTNGQLEVTIPFSGDRAAAQNALVTLQTAGVSSDGTNVMLLGQLTNQGDQPIVVEETDLTFQGDDGAFYLLLSTNPGFPWVVAPGETLTYQVAFQRPATSSAVIQILNQSFQVTGLR